MQSATPPQPYAKIVPGQQQLTRAQEDYFYQELEAQGAAMLSCEPIDKAQAEAHLRDAYRVAGLEPPRIRWFDSPGSFALASAYCKEWDDVWVEVVTNVVEDMSKCPAHQRLEKSLLLEMSLFLDERYTSLMEFIEAFLERGVWLFLNKRETVADDYYYRAKYKGWVYGRAFQDSITFASTCAYYLHDETVWHTIQGKLFEPGPAIHFALFNGMVSGYQLGREEAWLIRKPVRLEFDEQDKLHSASGKCIQYRDGWGVYGWRGVVVPAQLILHPQTLTRQDWLMQGNLEVRRAMTERLGPERFIELVGGTCIDEGSRGSLIVVDLGDDQERVAHYARVRDSSSGREYYLRVPPSIHRADEAVAWTFGMAEATYRPSQET
jgi:hypothetical protein